MDSVWHQWKHWSLHLLQISGKSAHYSLKRDLIHSIQGSFTKGGFARLFSISVFLVVSTWPCPLVSLYFRVHEDLS